MDHTILLVLLPLFCGTFQQQAVRGLCPERNGRFAHATQCDAYIECEDGEPKEKICPDGLLFNPKARYSYPCQYPVDVDCTGRESVQAAQSTEGCPHSYGFFKLGDERSCGQFVNCVNGQPYIFDCPEGLAFDPQQLRCDWPDQVPSCNAEAFLGFTCPEENGAFSPDIRLFRSANDCSRYFVCVKGRPRLLSCPSGQGFSDETGTCQDAEQIPGCIFPSSQEPVRSSNI